MKNESVLKVFFLSQPLLHTEWLSLFGDKYFHFLPFKLETVNDVQEAHVIAWDGVITPKNSPIIKDLVDSVKKDKVFLIQGESQTLFKSHPMVSQVDLLELNYVELSGWSVLPEEIIVALEKCQQKLKHV